jgi:hypothetical protein
MDLTLVLSGPHAEPRSLLAPIRRELAALGMRSSGDVQAVGFDAQRGVFDETEREGSSGIATEFDGDGYSIYLLVASVDRSFVNAYVEIEGSAIRSLVRKSRTNEVISIYLGVARACQAIGGFAQYDLPFAPVASSKVVSAIHRGPGQADLPALIGLVSMASMSAPQLKAFCGPQYTGTETASGYWVLRNRELGEEWA